MSKDLKWISVTERMPEEKETIFAKFKGTDKWNDNMFERMSEDVRVAMTLEDGRRMVGHAYTIDGKWNTHGIYKKTITHWMENPPLPEEEEDA